MKKQFNIPKFKNEDQERAFWAKVNLMDYFEPADFKSIFWSLSSSLKSKLRLSDTQIKRARKAFEKKWCRHIHAW